VVQAIPGATLNGFYIGEVQRVNGSREDLDGWGLNLSGAVHERLQATVFYYKLKFDDQAAWSADTLGLRLQGDHDINGSRSPATGWLLHDAQVYDLIYQYSSF
jgi:hypothetical protein